MGKVKHSSGTIQCTRKSRSLSTTGNQ
ncbi:unnamed protein product [Linum tenue]|uniref:Ribosomal protein S12 n=1 Tax=Linum tenue TaxID=586396 RepID=A0AAV0IVP0_9ROSI|nr:unnamed protein product [Linum tenue]